MNYHLKKAGHNRVVKNFAGDISDSVKYAVLLHSINPEQLTKEQLDEILKEQDLQKRAQMVVEAAKRMLVCYEEEGREDKRERRQ